MEFQLIEQHFKRQAKRPEIVLGNGDDCALIRSKHTLAVSIDTLVEGTHFLQNQISPTDLGYRALAVNLSDLAAMGARPLFFLLALTLPTNDQKWLEAFSQGLFSLADPLNCELIGGNMTKGPLAITIQITGELPVGKALKRSGAKAGDSIFVTGTLGVSPIRPTPRIDFAAGLLDLANAAIDMSDGLIQDLNHIAQSSAVGASLVLTDIPCREVEKALYRGEDYELCFTAPPKNQAAITALAKQTNTPLACIGKITTDLGILNAQTGHPILIKGYQHF